MTAITEENKDFLTSEKNDCERLRFVCDQSYKEYEFEGADAYGYFARIHLGDRVHNVVR